MSARYTVTHAHFPLHRKADRLARKHPRLSAAVATAVATAGIGAIGASAGATPWAATVGNLAMADHAGSGSLAGHAIASAFDSVIGTRSHAASAPGSRQAADGLQLDARHVPALGFVGMLWNSVTGWPAAASIVAHAPGAVGISSPAPKAAPKPVSTRPSRPAPSALAPSAPAPVKPAPAHAAPAPAARAPAARASAAPAYAAPAHVAPAHAAPAHPAPAHAAPAHGAAARTAAVRVAHVKHAKPAPPPKPYHIYDSVSPRAIPSHQDVATYANGAYAASSSDVAGRGHVLWIDTNGSDTGASALDVEPGDATPAGAAAWVKTKLNHDPRTVAIVYTMISQWQSVKDDMAGLPNWMQDKVRYWIADPTGVEHMLPGANATQWYWGNSYDITTANPGFQS